MNPSHSADSTLTPNQETVLPLAPNLHPSPSQNRSPFTIPSNTSESGTLHRCELMEKGLNEIRTALGALKMTCATLERHADRLGSEIAALKGLANTSLLAPMEQQINRNRTANSEVTVEPLEGPFSMNTPPVTPARRIRPLPQTEETSDIFSQIFPNQPSPNMGPPSSGILGKRRLSDQDVELDTQTSGWADSRRTTKPSKRVRFAEIEDLPTSHVRTPMHRLNLRSDSDDLMLPMPQLNIRCTGEIATPASLPPGNSIMDTPPLQRLVICPPTTKGRTVRMKTRDHTLPVRPLPGRTRQKTRWDAATGTRIPIAFAIPSVPVSQRLDIAESAEQDDYEQRLSYGLSNASLIG